MGGEGRGGQWEGGRMRGGVLLDDLDRKLNFFFVCNSTPHVPDTKLIQFVFFLSNSSRAELLMLLFFKLKVRCLPK